MTHCDDDTLTLTHVKVSCGNNHKSMPHEKPGTPGTKWKGVNLKILCHPICNWL